MDFGVQHHVVQGEIEQRVAGRSGIGHDKLAWIRVDVAFESQIHQHGSRQNDIQRMCRDAGGDVPAFLVQQQQQDLFCKPQHAFKPPTGTYATGSRFFVA